MGLDKILVVDDERVIRQAMELWLRDKRYGVSSADSMAGGDRMLRNDTFDLVFLDLNLPDGTGMELLERIQRMPERPHVVLMTGDATLASAISAIRLGAFDYLVKPFGKDNIELVLRRAEAFNHVVRVNQILSADLSDTRDLMGSSPAFETLREMIRKVAPTEATVLIEGENGTGKELVARAIYRASGRAQSPYIKVNCAAVPENLIESEFFGHEKGSFTGATDRREGRFELANGGTLLLDEISEIPAHLQAKLLRVLQEREFERVGGTKTIKVDVRVLAATNRDLMKAVAAGEFREDLFYRLNVFPVHVPALRERPADIPVLAEHFLKRFARLHGRGIPGFSAAASAALLQHRWSGNVRELQNAIERSVILTESGHQVEAATLGLAPAPNPQPYADGLAKHEPQEPSRPKSSPTLSLHDVEKEHILRTLEATGGNRARAADVLQISIRTLRNKLNEYQLNVGDEA
ncbi:acetoacetate metabolism regulatory protein AtoC [Verrucomicrobiota bacterium]|jgi:DNA-binding NtrC family response regulator|nr:acetoacetate metabolism regulatory protein AtoC [Verrucomicrobiota bacterium]